MPGALSTLPCTHLRIPLLRAGPGSSCTTSHRRRLKGRAHRRLRLRAAAGAAAVLPGRRPCSGPTPAKRLLRPAAGARLGLLQVPLLPPKEVRHVRVHVERGGHRVQALAAGVHQQLRQLCAARPQPQGGGKRGGVRGAGAETGVGGGQGFSCRRSRPSAWSCAWGRPAAPLGSLPPQLPCVPATSLHPLGPIAPIFLPGPPPPPSPMLSSAAIPSGCCHRSNIVAAVLCVCVA